MADRFASRRARSLAVELGLGGVAIVGTGVGGKVTVTDVRRAAPARPRTTSSKSSTNSSSKAASKTPSRGERLREAILADWKLRADELERLEAAVRTLDELDVLEQALEGSSPVVAGSRGQERPNVLLGEVRQHRLLLDRLLRGLGVDEADAAAEAANADGRERSTAGRRLAAQRWSKRRG